MNERCYYEAQIYLHVNMLHITIQRCASRAGRGQERSCVCANYNHSLSDSSTSDWILSPAEFEMDLQYLKYNNYHTVFISELINYVSSGEPLPENPIVLTFDDGYYNNYTYAMPLLEKYDMKIVISVLGKSTDEWTQCSNESDELGGYLTWQQIKIMSELGHVEFGNHTQNLHLQSGGRNGCAIKNGEDTESYKKLLTEDIETLQANFNENCGARPVCFTYPYGSICLEAEETIKELGFKASLSVSGGINKLRTGEAGCLYAMRRNNRSPDMSVEVILDKTT